MQDNSELKKTQQALRSVFIGRRNVKYNDGTKHFAHFKCKCCDTVYYVPIKESDIPKFRGSADMTISETQVYYLGTCEKCNKDE